MLFFINIGLVICTLGAAVSGLGGETWDKDKKHLPIHHRFTPRGWALALFILCTFLLGGLREIETRAENDRKGAEAAANQAILTDKLLETKRNLDDTSKRLGQVLGQEHEVLGQEAAIQKKADKAQGTLDATRDKLEQANTTNLISALAGSDKLVSEIWFIAPTEKPINSESDFENILRTEMGTHTCSLGDTEVEAYFKLPPEALIASGPRQIPGMLTVIEGTIEKKAIIRTSSMEGPWKDLMTYLGPSPLKAAYVVRISPKQGEKFSAASLLSQINITDDIFGYYAGDNHPRCMEAIMPHSILYLRNGLIFLVLDRSRNETILVPMMATKTKVFTAESGNKLLGVGFRKTSEPRLTTLQFAQYADEVSGLLDAQKDSDLVIH